MLLPKQRRKQASKSSQSSLRPRFRPQLERLEDRLVLNYSVSSTAFQWVELNGDPKATNLIGGGDDWANPIDLGGNTLNFYGTTYTGFAAVWASTNGLITLGSGNSSPFNGDLLTNPGQAAISPLWDDYYKSSGSPMVLSEVIGNNLIVEWNQAHDFVTDRPISFEAIIQLNTGVTPGNITFNYLQLDYYKSSSASVGIKDGGNQGPNAVVISVNSVNPLVDVNQAILLAWPSPAKVPSISSLSANSAAEGSSDLLLTVNGNNFGGASVVEVNGTALTTSFISGTQLQATLPASWLVEESSLSITVFTPGSLGGTSNAVAFSVTDAALTPSGQFLFGTEGQTITGGLVATFTDPGSDGTAADYSATVTWNDGNGQSHSSTGTVKLISGKTFGVYADNTVPYAEEGTYGVSVVIHDVGGSQATVTSQVMVSDASLTGSGASFSTTEGASFSGVVASFSDADPNGTVGDFTATINWGDGQSSAGTISAGPGGSFIVSGNHTYANEGNYSVLVQIADAGGATTSATGSAAVGDAALSAQGTPISSTEGSALSGVVATFTDANVNAPASDFTATINWGDGGSTTGTVTANGGGLFTVTGAYTYVEEGNYSITVSIADVGGASTSTGSSASVSDAPISASGTTVNPLEGTDFVGVVAGFTDADPSGTASDYHATIDWGDGTTSAGTIQVDPNGGFDVVGSHTYKTEGTTSITVTIQDMGGSNNTATASSTAVTGDAPLTEAGTITSATEGVAFSGALASFSDEDAFAIAENYIVSINWGDGTTGSGTVVDNPAGGFLVMGTHTYAEEGSKSVQVSILDDGGSSASVTSTVNISDASLSGAGMTLAATEGVAFSGAVATFTDASVDGTANDFSASIAWGDGITTAGTVSANDSGGFTVSGSHTYAQEGNFGVTVTLTDVGGSGAVANSTAQVADASLSASGSPVSSIEGGTFSGVVATFTDGNVNAAASDFSASINWGDGHTSAGVITSTGNGGFSISGTNSYMEEGTYSVAVQITDVGGASTNSAMTAAVAEAALQATGTTISATEGNVFIGSVASFTDANLNGELVDFTATISWGDGSTTTGSVIQTGIDQYFVNGSHTYAEEGTYTVGVHIVDESSTADANTNAVVADGALSASARSISSVEGGTFSGLVASFTDGNPAANAGDFSATINWGDGSSSAGTITANNSGGFDVSGSHSYIIEGTLSFSVTITDKGGASASVSGSAQIGDAMLAAVGVTLSETQGVAFTATVASFADAFLLSSASDFKAVISWGDGSSSNGTINQNGPGSFSVSGGHTYALAGNFSINVQIVDVGGATATASSTANVAAADPADISATGRTMHAVEGLSFTAVVANFSDGNASLTAKDFSATINWGDGTNSAGTISANSSGNFNVTGTHNYAAEGTEAISITIKDSGGNMASANSTVLVADSIPVVQATVHHEKHKHHVVLAGAFSDSALENHQVLVNWGDGTSTIYNLGVSKSGQFSFEHNYTGQFLAKHHGVVHITVSVLDDDGTASAPQVLSVNFNEGHHHVNEGNQGHQENHGDLWDIPGLDFFS